MSEKVEDLRIIAKYFMSRRNMTPEECFLEMQEGQGKDAPPVELLRKWFKEFEEEKVSTFFYQRRFRCMTNTF